jgi:hypothetical protein
VGGVGGRVEITSLEISVVGVWLTNTFHRRAKGKMRHRINISPSNVPGCKGPCGPGQTWA